MTSLQMLDSSELLPSGVMAREGSRMSPGAGLAPPTAPAAEKIEVEKRRQSMRQKGRNFLKIICAACPPIHQDVQSEFSEGGKAPFAAVAVVSLCVLRLQQLALRYPLLLEKRYCHRQRRRHLPLRAAPGRPEGARSGRFWCLRRASCAASAPT